MSSRVYPKLTTTSTPPADSKLGDQYYDPVANQLYELVPVNGTTVSWVQIPLVLGGNLVISGPNTVNPVNFGSLQVGSTLNFSDTGIIASFVSSTNSYSQVINQNANNGTQASSDFIVNNDSAAGGTSIYGDFGINSTNFNNPTDSFGDANGTYLYAAGGSLSQGTLNNFDYKLISNSVVRLTANGTTGNIAIANTFKVNATIVIANTTTTNTASMIYNASLNSIDFYFN